MKRIIGLSVGLLIAVSLAGCCHRQGYRDPCTGLSHGGGFGSCHSSSGHGLFSWLHHNNHRCCDDPCGYGGYPYDYGYGGGMYYDEPHPATSYDGDCCGGGMPTFQGGVPIEGAPPGDPILPDAPPAASTYYQTIPTPTFNSSGSSTPLYIPGSYRRIPHHRRGPATLYW